MRIIDLVTQIAAYGDRVYLSVDLPAMLEDRLRTLQRLHELSEP